MGKARRRAQADAHAATLPQRQGIRRERRGARRDYRQGVRANESAYGALDRTLADIGNDYRKDYQKLGTGFRSSLTPMQGMAGFGGGAESVAGLANLNSIGQSGMAGLAQQRQRGVESTRSTRTQGAIEEKSNSMNMLADFHNRIEELRNSTRDLDAQEGAMVQSLLPGYREEIAAQREEDEFRQWLIDQMRGEGGGGGGGGPTLRDALSGVTDRSAGFSRGGLPGPGSPDDPRINYSAPMGALPGPGSAGDPRIGQMGGLVGERFKGNVSGGSNPLSAIRELLQGLSWPGASSIWD